MRDADLVSFLRELLPRLDLDWRGFRKVRRQVGRRLAARLAELQLASLEEYAMLIAGEPAERRVLDRLCRVTISRFWRDRRVYEHLAAVELPRAALAAREDGRRRLLLWSAGCASGEEPFSVAIGWQLLARGASGGVCMRMLATDVDMETLRRAVRGPVYGEASVRELPVDWRRRAFDTGAGGFRLRDEFRQGVAFARHDLRDPVSGACFDGILCRNVAFTYFAEGLRRLTAARLASLLRPGGFLLVGAHETLPGGAADFDPVPGCPCLYRRSA
jgi:chemotaxis protein methyltransferase CheR